MFNLFERQAYGSTFTFSEYMRLYVSSSWDQSGDRTNSHILIVTSIIRISRP